MANHFTIEYFHGHVAIFHKASEKIVKLFGSVPEAVAYLKDKKLEKRESLRIKMGHKKPVT
jgi:hypothetical protein